MENLQENTKKDEKTQDFDKNSAKKADFLKKFSDLLKEYNYELSISMNFPDYLTPPDELRLALLIVGKHKHEFVFNLKELNNEN